MSPALWGGAALAAWAAVVLAAFYELAAYSMTPGPSQAPGPLGLVDAPFSPSANKFLLVMALHPRCPCSTASVGELSRILARFPSQLQTVFLVYRPSRSDESWTHSGLVSAAAELPGSSVFFDDDGRLAARLGLATSGAVVLYSPRGDAEFWGGITPARGHWGDNIGSDAVLAVLAGAAPARRSAPAYGCRIHAPPTRPDSR